MPKQFYSNGKLLLSGEYLILDGAKGLAIPTKYGQSMAVDGKNSAFLEWKSLDVNKNVWFSAKFKLPNLELHATSDQHVFKTLQVILKEAKRQNPVFLQNSRGVEVSTKLQFPKNWGLGSSSTLINNIAQWAQVDAYGLLKKTMGGSGYDIACAQYDQPILYHLEHGTPQVEPVDFNPFFKDRLYFVHLNQKQDSRQAIAQYRARNFDLLTAIHEVTSLTKNLLEAKTISVFESIIETHEAVLSDILKTEPIKKRLFSDYFGQLKSLGGWGGDFVLATGNEKTPEYFTSKGFQTILSFEEMVLNKT